jgi:hypothetical protein
LFLAFVLMTARLAWPAATLLGFVRAHDGNGISYGREGAVG